MVQLIIDGLIGEVISRGIDVSKSAIKSAMEKQEYKSIHTQIYSVIVETVRFIAKNPYKNNEDVILEVAQDILKIFKTNQENEIESVKSCLKAIYPDVSDEVFEYFKKILYEKVCKEEILFNEILLRLQKQGYEYNYKQFQEINRKLDELKKVSDEKVGEVEKNTNVQIEEFKNNKKEEYIKKWNDILFLHRDNKENPLTLAKTFIVPAYKMEKSVKRIGFSDKDALDDIIDKFIQYDRRSTMLIIGVPGIGKSSITSWIANNYQDNDDIIILRFRDWEKIELQSRLLKTICTTLGCKRTELEHKILILDGFDEMKSLENRETLLNSFFDDILDLQSTKFIITSRPTYISSSKFNNVLELSVFNIRRIQDFYYNITKTKLNVEKIDSEEVLGIPVILYMAIMSNIDITKSATKPKLYSRIFAETGGIFDKFCYEGISYSEGQQILRNSENIKNYLDFLCNTAFRMFEKDSLALSNEEYQIPTLQFQEESVNILEFPIKYLFENTKTNIEFVHKSIYEYFVSEYIFILLCKNIGICKEKFAGILGNMFKGNKLSSEILEFLKFKIDNNTINGLFDIINETFQLMEQDGMTYYTQICYKNVIKCERYVFVNMLEVLHLWKWEKDYLKLNNFIYIYLMYGSNDEFFSRGLNLEKIDLSELILKDMYLVGVNLIDAKLVGVNLKGTNLTNADLTNAKLMNAELVDTKLIGAKLETTRLMNANLTNADLTSAKLMNVKLMDAKLIDAKLIDAKLIDADLTGADLTRTNLIGSDIKDIKLFESILIDTIFDEKQVGYLKNKYDISRIKVYIEKTGEIRSYIEYENENIIKKKKWFQLRNKKLK